MLIMSYTFTDGNSPLVDFDTVSGALEYFKVCRTHKHKEDSFLIIEGCDEYFGITLTKKQLIDYANELLQLSES